MDNRQIWKLADELSLFEIILLLGRRNPSDFESLSVEAWEKDVKRDVSPYRVIVQNAVRSGSIHANLAYSETESGREIDWHLTRVNIESLTYWLRSKNFDNSFFTDGDEDEIPGFADRNGLFYAPKLAAAVNAWVNVTSNPDLLKNKTPKQALDKWLREHAAEYGLTTDSGNPNNQGISEICKIANWKPEGGATPTNVVDQKGHAPSQTTKLGGGQLRGKPTTRSVKPAKALPDDDMDIPF